MSASEIADNKWELSATKPEVVTFAGMAQIVMMIGFCFFFAYMLTFSLIGAFGPARGGSLADAYQKMQSTPEGTKAAAGQ